MRVVLMVAGLLVLGGCGGGGTTGTNYADTPPMAEIVGTPTPKPSETPEAIETEPVANVAGDEAVENEVATENAL